MLVGLAGGIRADKGDSRSSPIYLEGLTRRRGDDSGPQRSRALPI